MNYFVVSIVALFLIACGEDYHYIHSSEFNGVTVKSHRGVHTVAVKIQAKASCSSHITLIIGGTRYAIPIKHSIDTILKQDWYGEPLEFKVELDSCVMKDPVIGIKFID
jgi:hypothetical protein